MKGNTVLIILAVIIIGLGAWYIVSLPKGNVSPTGNQQAAGEPTIVTTPPAATGNVNDIVSSILQDANNDAAVFSQETQDTSLLSNTDQTVGGFGQTYNETQF